MEPKQRPGSPEMQLRLRSTELGPDLAARQRKWLRTNSRMKECRVSVVANEASNFDDLREIRHIVQNNACQRRPCRRSQRTRTAPLCTARDRRAPRLFQSERGICFVGKDPRRRLDQSKCCQLFQQEKDVARQRTRSRQERARDGYAENQAAFQPILPICI